MLSLKLTLLVWSTLFPSFFAWAASDTAAILCSMAIHNGGPAGNSANNRQREKCEADYGDKADAIIRECALRSAPRSEYVKLKSYRCQEAGGLIRAYGTKNSNCIPETEIPKFESCLDLVSQRMGQEYVAREKGANKESKASDCSWGVASSIACPGKPPKAQTQNR